MHDAAKVDMPFLLAPQRHVSFAALACAALFGPVACAPEAADPTEPPGAVLPGDAGPADREATAVPTTDGREDQPSVSNTAAADGGPELGCIQGCAAPPGTPCGVGLPLAGIAYDVTKSRFAFGSTPPMTEVEGFAEWTGTDGFLAIRSDGSEVAFLNPNAPEQALADWSSNPSAATAHAADYLGAMGLEACQSIGNVETFIGDPAIPMPTLRVAFTREILYVAVPDSSAVVRFDADDQTTYESVWWPEIPADVVAAARAIVLQLEVRGTAAFTAKLPANAQIPGGAVIHHSPVASTRPFVAVAMYATFDSAQNAELDFDIDGNPVADTWSAR
ncbi:MAG TPA: hypothetical protein VGM06_18265 [Polyangiaceae bacterium]|jgi:hypothetical protein